MSIPTNKNIGGFLIIEGILSVLLSEDKRGIAQLSRFARIGIGTIIYRKPCLPEK